MKLLVHNFESYSVPDLIDVLNQLGISHEVFYYEFTLPGHSKNHDDEFVSWFCEKYSSSDFDAVIGINYFAPIAVACHKLNMKYISWSYDCPMDIEKPEETLILPNVHCFLFDKIQQQEFKSKGLDNVYYMPLGANANRYKNYQIYKKECDKYRTEISFIGRLYEQSSYSYISSLVNDNTRELLNKIVETQRNLPQMNMLDQLLTDRLIQVIDNEMHSNSPEFNDNVTKARIQYAIECQIARTDRILILNLLGKRHRVDFYSHSKFDILEGVHCHPPVDYWKEMPWIFAASKINLNPTLPAIHSGINLRAFDITACGGLMFINRQPEIDEFFIENKEAVVYDSVYDLIDKADYYLNHEAERKKIAEAGRIHCLNEHTMKNRIENILKVAFK